MARGRADGGEGPDGQRQQVAERVAGAEEAEGDEGEEEGGGEPAEAAGGSGRGKSAERAQAGEARGGDRRRRR